MLLGVHSIQQTAFQSRPSGLKYKVNCCFISQNAYLQYVCFYLFILSWIIYDFDTSLIVMFKCEVIKSDIIVEMWVNWMKTSHPICHSQWWKRAAATRRFKLVRTVSTFLPLSPCFFYSKWTNQIRSQDKRRSRQTSALLFSPLIPTHKSLVILPAPDVWDTDVAFLNYWPQSIVFSWACGKCIFPLGLRN